MTDQSKSAAAEQKATGPRFETIKMYLKDVSFEAPSSPMIFLEKSDKPKSEVNVDIEHSVLDESSSVVEVVLKITITATQEDKTLYIAEVNQGGIFQVQHPEADAKAMMMEVTCPHILLPFAREELNNVITKGGFNAFLLAPINFDGLYKSKKAAQQNVNGDSVKPESLN